MTIEKVSTHFIDKNNLKNSLFFDIKTLVNGYVSTCPPILVGGANYQLKSAYESEYDEELLERFGHLLEGIDNLASLEPEIYYDDDINDSINKYISSEVLVCLRAHHASYLNSLKRGYVNGHKTPSASHIEAIENISLESIYAKDWSNELQSSGGNNILDTFEIRIVEKVEALIDALRHLEPWQEQYNHLKDSDLNKIKNNYINNRNVLVRIVNRIANDLPNYVLGEVKNDNNKINSIKKHALGELDSIIGEINQQYGPSYEVPISREARKAEYYAGAAALKETVEIEHIDRPKEVKVEVRDYSHETKQETEIKFTDIGEFEYDFPWLKKSEFLRTVHVTGGKQDVFVVRALTPKLKKLLRASHDGLPKNSKGEDKIDLAKKQIAKRISEGIMPYEDTNSVKSLSTQKKDMREEYQDIKVWYSHDISPNPPRVYFTLMDTNEQLKKYAEDRPSIMVVIVAEGDKQRQDGMLVRLTKLDRATLVARGAGSI